jgi:hypothetical protein
MLIWMGSMGKENMGVGEKGNMRMGEGRGEH